MFYLISGGIAALVLVSYILIDPTKKRLNVKDELVVITGGTSGLGLEIALECLRRGAKVILLARKVIDLKSHDKLKQFQGQVKSISCDVTKRDDLQHTRAEIEKDGQVGFLFCCAGLSRQAQFELLPVKDIDSQVNVNLMGTINAVYTFLPGMKSNSKGRICIISSVGGQIGLWGMSHYCATKFALKGLTEGIQMELLDTNIAATIVYPPDMPTPGFEEENKTKPAIARAIAELGGIVEPSTMAGPLIDAVETGQVDYSVGIDGWFCSRQNIGMGPASSVMNVIAELTLSNFFRLIALGYRKIILQIIRKGAKDE